jgi:hypothetical protein
MGVGGQYHALAALPPGKTQYPLFPKYIIVQKFSLCLVLLYLIKAYCVKVITNMTQFSLITHTNESVILTPVCSVNYVFN